MKKTRTVFQELATLLRTVVRDFLTLIIPSPNPWEAFSLCPEGLKRFPFPEEIAPILEVARGYFGNPQDDPINPYALILAIRASERGRKGFEFGVVAAKDTDLKTQCAWACATVRNTLERFKHQTAEKDFIAFLGRRYAPVGAENDPQGLNQNWVRNVRFFYHLFHGEVSPKRFWR